MCPSLHPNNIGRPNAATDLDQALASSLGCEGARNTTADDIADCQRSNYYDIVTDWIAGVAKKP